MQTLMGTLGLEITCQQCLTCAARPMARAQEFCCQKAKVRLSFRPRIITWQATRTRRYEQAGKTCTRRQRLRRGAFCHAAAMSRLLWRARHRLKQRGVKEDRKRATATVWGFRGFWSRFDGIALAGWPRVRPACLFRRVKPAGSLQTQSPVSLWPFSRSMIRMPLKIPWSNGCRPYCSNLRPLPPFPPSVHPFAIQSVRPFCLFGPFSELQFLALMDAFHHRSPFQLGTIAFTHNV